MNKPRCSVNNWLPDKASGAIVHRQTGEVRRLGEYQLKLLECLIEHAGQTLSRNELTSLVWERRVIGDNSLSNAIHALRTALEDDGKLQRVIKTIPKKGYLLDVEFCQPVEPEEDIAPLSVAAVPPVMTAPVPVEVPESLAAKTVTAEHSHAPQSERRKFSTFFWPLVSTFLLTCLILFSGWFFMFHATFDEMQAQEQVKNQYSNIRIFRIAAAVDEMNDEDIIKFKSILRTINQQLIANDAWMTVYYRTDEQVLNYTFSIETSCASEQLAMTLYHWRIDNQKLTKTINDETERKLNELAPCKKS
ncbi:winged helix-turn-helix domain-containing protein [Buttiauxella sp.]|uniref:winged helix-turn-helix domain-containing protein n=1 Tax=Buttiauxella sp. TaxID=1972222 RepID=UPI003C718166